MSMTETALHAQRHKRVLKNRSRIAHKARRDAQLRQEANIRRIKSSDWLEDIGAQQREAEITAYENQKKQMAAAKQRESQKGWISGLASKAAAFLRRRP